VRNVDTMLTKIERHSETLISYPLIYFRLVFFISTRVYRTKIEKIDCTFSKYRVEMNLRADMWYFSRSYCDDKIAVDFS